MELEDELFLEQSRIQKDKHHILSSMEIEKVT